MPQNINTSYTLSLIMTMFKAKVKQWGNSLGIVIPKEITQKEHLTADKEIFIEIKQNPLVEAFGILKHKKINAQKAKDELRKAWF